MERTTIKTLIFFCLLLLSHVTIAQVGIGTTTPDATFEVQGDATSLTAVDGILPPRLTGDQLSAKTGYGSNQTGTLVYVTAADSTPSGSTVSVTQPGYYFFDGSVWQRVIVKSTDTNLYTDNGTLTSTRDVTTNNFDLRIDGSTLAVDGSANRVGVGTTGPSTTLDVNGNARIRTLPTGASSDQVLSTDNNGNIRKRVITNIYDANGTLTSNRFINQGSRTISFNSNADNAFSINNNLFNVDTNTFSVGIGTNAPNARLHIVGFTYMDGSLEIDNNEGNIKYPNWPDSSNNNRILHVMEAKNSRYAQSRYISPLGQFIDIGLKDGASEFVVQVNDVELLNVSLSQNRTTIKDVLNLRPRSGPPTFPKEGDLFYGTHQGQTRKLWLYNGFTWTALN